MKFWQHEAILESFAEKGVSDGLSIVRKRNVPAYKEIGEGVEFPFEVKGNWGWLENKKIKQFLADRKNHILLVEATANAHEDRSVHRLLQIFGRFAASRASTNIFPLVVIDTKWSYTVSIDRKTGIQDPDFFDPEGPKKAEKLILEVEVPVLRVSEADMQEKVRQTVQEILAGKKPEHLVFP